VYKGRNGNKPSTGKKSRKTSPTKKSTVIQMESPGMGSMGKSNNPDSMDEMIQDFDVDEEAQYDELDRME
jgi:hypothetical protein